MSRFDLKFNLQNHKIKVEAAELKLHSSGHGYNNGFLLKQLQKVISLLTEEQFVTEFGGDTMTVGDQATYRQLFFQHVV